MFDWLKKKRWQPLLTIGLSPPYADQVADFELRLPKTGECANLWSFQMVGSVVPPGLREQIPAIFRTVVSPIHSYLAVMISGCVHSHHATVFDRAGEIKADLSDALVPDQGVWNTATHSISSKGRLPEPWPWQGELAVLSSPYCNNYYHWLFDTLPRLEAEVCQGQSKLYVHQYRPFQRETLRILGIDPVRLVAAESHPFVRADLLLVPSLPFPPLPAPPSVWRLPVVSAAACRFLRQELAPRAMRAAAAGMPRAGKRRLFIRRQGARAIVNQGEVWKMLERQGFSEVALESLSVAEQIAVFAQAEVVVGVHGAGLSNVVFCRPGTRVVEMMPSAWAMPCYWSVSRHVGLDYHRLEVTSVPVLGSPANASSEVLVDLESLRGLLL